MTEPHDNEDFDMLGKLITDQLMQEGVAATDALQAAAHVLERLQATHGGTKLYIPSARQQRNHEILQRRHRGEKPDAIADALGVDRSTVYRVLGRRSRAADDGDTGFGSVEWSL